MKIASKAGVAVTIFAVMAICAALGSWHQKKNGTIMANEGLKQELEAVNASNELYAKDIKAAKHKLAECSKKIADPAKRNVSDMRNYIMARYSKVPVELADIISQKTNALADKHDVDFALVVGVMDVESAFNPFAISKADARGLMQIMFKVWSKTYDIKKASDLHDIERNIEIGIQVLKHYINKHEGSIRKALTAYNGGGKTYTNEVYVAIGRFTAYRNNSYQTVKEEPDASGRIVSTRNPKIPERVSETAQGS